MFTLITYIALGALMAVPVLLVMKTDRKMKAQNRASQDAFMVDFMSSVNSH